MAQHQAGIELAGRVSSLLLAKRPEDLFRRDRKALDPDSDRLMDRAGDCRCSWIEANLADALGAKRAGRLVRRHKYLLQRRHVRDARNTIIGKIWTQRTAFIDHQVLG